MKAARFEGLRFVLLVYAASRLFYLAAGVLLVKVLPVAPGQTASLDDPFGSMNMWTHYDGEHYAQLAAYGYLNEPSRVSPAFFPLYPLLIRSFAGLFGGPLSLPALALWGVLLSMATLPFAFYFVYRITENGWGERVAQGTVLSLAFFPTSFFLNAAFTESIFLTLSAGALWAAMVRKNLLLACLMAGLATATRNVGIFLLVPLAYEWARNASYYRWRVVYLALAPWGLLAYIGYLWWRFGEPLLFYTEQEKWSRQATGPLTTLENMWKGAKEGARWVYDPESRAGEVSVEQITLYLNSANITYSLALFGLAVVLLLVGLRVLPLGLSAYAFLTVIIPVFFGTPGNPLFGFSRYMLVVFPLFIVLGVLLKNRWLLGAWLLFSAAASLVLCALFVNWWYVA